MDLNLDNLNSEQRDAVTQVDGPLLILAGAGTGKTTTIVYRVAYLINNGIPPGSILTLTFTNKAAKEMRERTLKLITKVEYPPLLSTFHKFGLILLKLYIGKLGRSSNFTVIDSSDVKKIIKDIIKNYELDIDKSLTMEIISGYKNSMKFSKELENRTDPVEKIAIIVYQKYEEFLLKNNLVDFDDLLFLPYTIIKNDEKLNSELSNKYKYIMIDEYQDTNYLQFSLIKLLTKNHNNIAVVGDDDQSIYSWRGADIRNILYFNEEFDNSKTVKLEQNYRSSENILNYANKLIINNIERHEKSLKSNREENNIISIDNFYNENREAEFIAKDILNIQKYSQYDSIAIIYRINYLSRAVEEALNKFEIAYVMIGNTKFYERAEIKDIISYLRVIDNIDDDYSLDRVINRPTRGIGNSSYSKIKEITRVNKCSIHSALKNNLLDEIPKKALNSLKELMHSLTELCNIANDHPVEIIDKLEQKIGIKKYYKSKVDSFNKEGNIDEFYALFKERFKDNKLHTIKIFLEEITLNDDVNKELDVTPVNVMSIHSTKGLEFDRVYVIGLEEGILPIISEDVNIEEERRLLYVAITRAKKNLSLTYADERFYKGSKVHLKKSRFIKEILTGKTTHDDGLLVNTYVKHKLFGIGKILKVTKFGDGAKLQIDFSGSYREILSDFVTKL